ncbi:transglutaminase-like domain-containing protein [Fictibacillus terranigra]|uniref:Transglutaminase-like domain-containing protein n=1 Tax=Fictibacillus terranigra TaxID=3058424 RepID=A0ABT8ED85_9BACL|nr:transglutaminase-like domain-containing protein [Fictibacillus sp. CENA-BCM004]MDN4075896.1 transglutaminase-like domain-containing protein [Fictibacillus sp. CENA-BCM004]
MRKILLIFILPFLLVILPACSLLDTADPKMDEGPAGSRYTAAAEKNNEKTNLEQVQLSGYSRKVGATLTSPKYRKFSVNSAFTVSGSIKNTQRLKSNYALITVHSAKGGIPDFKYLAPIKGGKYKQKVQLFDGKGTYKVKVSLPSEESKGYYYDLTEMEVTNVNPEVKRDILYTQNAYQQDLKLDSSVEGYMKRDGKVDLSGWIGNKNAEDLMIEMSKGTQVTKVMVPLDHGRFQSSLPLYFGKGIHTIKIMTPAENMANYYNQAAELQVDNTSDQTSQPVEFSKEYSERGYTLETPAASGGETDLDAEVKGKIDPNAPFAKETDTVFVQTKKGSLEAMYAIPVKNYTFDGKYYLRFGPGHYEVNVFAPEISSANTNVQHFTGIAHFSLENMNPNDGRYRLPSRGIQSDDPEIGRLSQKLMQGKANDKEKALAVYRFVAKNVRYDVQKLNQRSFAFDDSAIKTLHDKKGVCQDFSYLGIALLRAGGMEARMATGYAGQDHAWIEAKVDGRWMTMDPTWGSGYLQANRFIQNFTMKYFDPDPAEFKKTHTKSGIEY